MGQLIPVASTFEVSVTMPNTTDAYFLFNKVQNKTKMDARVKIIVIIIIILDNFSEIKEEL